MKALITDHKEEAAHQNQVAMSSLIVFQVHEPSNSYYFAQADNLHEALVEHTDEIKRNRMENLLKARKYEELGRMIEDLSIAYWTEHLEFINKI